MKKILTENEWINENLKMIAESNGNRLDFINRKGKSANFPDQENIIEKLKELNLAECDKIEGHLTEFGEGVMAVGGWLEYIELKNQQLSKEKLLQDKMSVLTIENLRLQNRKMKRDILFGIIGFIIASIVTNWKDILILMKVLQPE